MGSNSEDWKAKLLDGAIRIPLFSSWKDEDQMVYAPEVDHVDLPLDGILCLVGCNGSGKTTTVEQVKQALGGAGFRDAKDEKEYNPLHGWRSLMGGKDDKAAGYLVLFDKGARFVPNKGGGGESWFSAIDIDTIGGWFCSNGEGVSDRFAGAAKAMGTFFKKAREEGVPIIIMVDDADAGTSIDVVSEMRSFLEGVDRDLKKAEVPHLILVTSNSYELIHDLPCLYVRDMTPRTFTTYEEFRDFTFASRKDKDARDKERAKAVKARRKKYAKENKE